MLDTVQNKKVYPSLIFLNNTKKTSLCEINMFQLILTTSLQLTSVYLRRAFSTEHMYFVENDKYFSLNANLQMLHKTESFEFSYSSHG